METQETFKLCPTQIRLVSTAIKHVAALSLGRKQIRVDMFTSPARVAPPSVSMVDVVPASVSKSGSKLQTTNASAHPSICSHFFLPPEDAQFADCLMCSFPSLFQPSSSFQGAINLVSRQLDFRFIFGAAVKILGFSGVIFGVRRWKREGFIFTGI